MSHSQGTGNVDIMSWSMPCTDTFGGLLDDAVFECIDQPILPPINPSLVVESKITPSDYTTVHYVTLHYTTVYYNQYKVLHYIALHYSPYTHGAHIVRIV